MKNSWGKHLKAGTARAVQYSILHGPREQTLSSVRISIELSGITGHHQRPVDYKKKHNYERCFSSGTFYWSIRFEINSIRPEYRDSSRRCCS
jgi:hypothetical protein